MDNSILTVFPYLSNSENRFKFIPVTQNQQAQFNKNQQAYNVNIQSTDDRNAVDKVHNLY